MVLSTTAFPCLTANGLSDLHMQARPRPEPPAVPVPDPDLNSYSSVVRTALVPCIKRWRPGQSHQSLDLTYDNLCVRCIP